MNILQVLEVFMSGYNSLAGHLSSFFPLEISPRLNENTLVLGFLATQT